MTDALSFMDQLYLEASRKKQKRMDYYHAPSKFCLDLGELIIENGHTNKSFAKHAKMKHKRLIKILNGDLPSYDELAKLAWHLGKKIEFTLVSRWE